MTQPPHKRILQHFDISEQGLRELEIWLEKNQEPNWGPWVYVGTAPTNQNITHLSPPFQNSWANAGGGKQRLRFRRTMPTNLKKKQSLEIEGDITNTGTVTGTVIFTLPKGYRPREASGPVVAANTDNAVVIWEVATNGDVIYVDLAAAGSGGGSTFGTPALTLGTVAAAGSIDQVIRKDSTIVAFDATVPATQAFGDTAAAGSAAVAARRDHKHAMPATPVTSIAKSGSTALTGVVTLTGGTNVTLTQAGQDISIASSSGGGGATKLYDYEVTGSDKASIDTNVDGTTVANFNGYTTLLVYLYVRTDEAGTTSQVSVTLNNDTGANYDRQVLSAVDTTVAAGNAIAATAFNFAVNGASYAANYFSVLQMAFPNYLGTVGYKNGTGQNTRNDNTNANSALLVHALNFRSTSAVSRLKVTPLTAGKKMVVGTRLLIYGM